MRKNLFFAIILVLVTFSTSACLSLSEEQRKEYGLLESAVTFSSDKVIGEYGDVIPDDFNSNKFLQLVLSLTRFLGAAQLVLLQEKWEEILLDMKSTNIFYRL